VMMRWKWVGGCWVEMRVDDEELGVSSPSLL
jgi:hypothetical protein